jgi:hypothetical protein
MARRSLVTLVMALGIIVGVGAPAGATTLLFHDYFNSSSDPAWTFYNRSGEISGGQLRIDGGYQTGAVGRDGWVGTHVGDTTWKNYSFHLTYDSTNPGGAPSPNVHQAGLLVRAKNMTPGHQTFYRFDVWDKGAGDPSGPGYCGGRNGAPLPKGMVTLSKAVNGVGEFNLFSCDSNSVIGSNAATVTVTGPSIMLSVNGKRVFAINDVSPIVSGGVGALAIWESVLSIDNVKVSG